MWFQNKFPHEMQLDSCQIYDREVTGLVLYVKVPCAGMIGVGGILQRFCSSSWCYRGEEQIGGGSFCSLVMSSLTMLLQTISNLCLIALLINLVRMSPDKRTSGDLRPDAYPKS